MTSFDDFSEMNKKSINEYNIVIKCTFLQFNDVLKMLDGKKIGWRFIRNV